MTALLKLWGFNAELGRWYDLGYLNGGTPIGESKSDVLESAFGVMGLSAFNRLYCEIVGALGGTSTAIKVDGIAIQPRAGV